MKHLAGKYVPKKRVTRDPGLDDNELRHLAENLRKQSGRASLIKQYVIALPFALLIVLALYLFATKWPF